MRRYAKESQLWVVSYATELQRVLCSDHAANHVQLDKELGETIARSQEMFDAPYWKWPKR